MANLPDDLFMPTKHSGTAEQNVKAFIENLSPNQLIEIGNKKDSNVARLARLERSYEDWAEQRESLEAKVKELTE